MSTIKQALSLILLCMLFAGCTQAQVIAPPTSLPTNVPVSANSTKEPAKTVQVSGKPAELKSAEEKAGFKMSLPATLPEDYEYSSALYLPDQQGILVQAVWRKPEFTGEMLFFTQQRKAPTLPKEAVPEKLQIGGSDAIFYQGGLLDTGWVSEAPVYTLRFTLDGFYYTIVFNGNERSSAGWVTKEEMIRLAEQLR